MTDPRHCLARHLRAWAQRLAPACAPAPIAPDFEKRALCNGLQDAQYYLNCYVPAILDPQGRVLYLGPVGQEAISMEFAACFVEPSSDWARSASGRVWRRPKWANVPDDLVESYSTRIPVSL